MSTLGMASSELAATIPTVWIGIANTDKGESESYRRAKILRVVREAGTPTVRPIGPSARLDRRGPEQQFSSLFATTAIDLVLWHRFSVLLIAQANYSGLFSGNETSMLTPGWADRTASAIAVTRANTAARCKGRVTTTVARFSRASGC
jgi:hypothetical protein